LRSVFVSGPSPPAAFALVFLGSLALAWPALPWPMTFDDLPLLRTHSARELAGAFAGQWDADRVMTRGYRPLSLVFNHARAWLFGENVVAHRLFLLALGAGFWAWLSLSLRAWGLAPRTTLLAGALWFTSIYSTFHYAWITDGNHMAQGLGFALAVAGLAAARRRRPSLGLTGTFLGFLAALLVREDSLAVGPALLLMGFALARGSGRRGRLVALAVGLVVVAAAVLGVRRVLVPRAAAPGSDLLAPLLSFGRSASPAGTLGFDAPSWGLVLGWWPLVAALALALVRRGQARGPGLWLACALGACAPALNVYREDLLFFPVAFTSLALADSAGRLWRAGLRLLPAVAVAWALLGGARMSRVFAENFHPDSLRSIWWNGRYVYGAYAARARIPEERRGAVVARLHRFGIDEAWGHEVRTRNLVARAVREGRRRPSGGRPFYPLLPWHED
jgi:MYXO-CTERM domain-containing protein